MANVAGFPETVLVSYDTKGKAPAFPVASDRQLHVFNARSFNNSGGPINVGICRRHINSQISLYTATTGGTVYTLQNVTPSSFTAITAFSTTVNNGIVVQSPRRFNLIGLHVLAGQADGVYAVQYWNGAAWVTFTTLETADFTSASDDADVWTAFQAPSAWVVGGPTGLFTDQFAIRIIATTAAAGNVTINQLWVAEFLEFYFEVPNNAAVQMSYPDSKPFCLDGGEGLFPYYETANAANSFGCYYSSVI